jgi:hypothetical protein
MKSYIGKSAGDQILPGDLVTYKEYQIYSNVRANRPEPKYFLCLVLAVISDHNHVILTMNNNITQYLGLGLVHLK